MEFSPRFPDLFMRLLLGILAVALTVNGAIDLATYGHQRNSRIMIGVLLGSVVGYSWHRYETEDDDA